MTDTGKLSKPVILNSKTVGHTAMFARLLKTCRRSDFLLDQLKELFFIRSPHFKKNPQEGEEQFQIYLKSLMREGKVDDMGNWVYIPWSKYLVKVLKRDYFYELRTARNRNLITSPEQKKLRDLTVLIAGLSVGNSVALSLALEGVEHFALFDFDTLAVSNLNRIRAGVMDIGVNKARLAERQIYELNPYASIRVFEHGFSEESVKKIIQSSNAPHVIVDEMDDLKAKMSLRLMARGARVPVVSVADNGDGAIADVERFDLEPARLPFHGMLKEKTPEELSALDFSARIKRINRIVGVDYVTARMKESIIAVGTKIYSWPQLGGAAMLAGGVVAYLVKKIALGERLASGKYDVSLDRIFTKNYDARSHAIARQKNTKNFLRLQEKMFQSR